jgi:hypothetical protein
MSLLQTAFSYELSKIAEEKGKKRKGYGAAFMATAPLAVAQAAGDFPKGYVDKKVEVAVAKGLGAARKAKAWKMGTGRAAGRLVAGPVSAPLFFSGIKDIQEGDRKKGYAKVLAASGGYSAGKGAVEAAIESGGSRKQVLKAIKEIGGTRGLIGLGAGVVTAASIAEAQKGKKKSERGRFVIPAAIGAGLGAAKGGVEGLMDSRVEKTLRGVGGKAAGRAASGVIGALAISEIARKLHGGKTKKASALPEGSQPIPNMNPTPSAIYAKTRHEAKTKSTETLESFLKARTDPESSPSRRAITYAVNDELRVRGVKVQDEEIRKQTHPPMVPGTSVLHTAAAAAVVAAPALVWSAGLADLSLSEKDMVLRDAMENMIAQEGIGRTEASVSERIPGRMAINFDRGEPVFLRVGDRDAAVNAILRGDQKSDKAKDLAVKMVKELEEGQTRFISSTAKAHPAELAHELGHATAGSLRRRTIASGGASMVREIAMIPAIALPLIALDTAADRSFHTKEEIEAKAKFAEGVGVVAGLLAAPGLAEEATASLKGMNYLRRAGADASTLARHATTKLAPAFLTYSAPFLTGAVAAKILRSRISKAEKAEKRKTR